MKEEDKAATWRDARAVEPHDALVVAHLLHQRGKGSEVLVLPVTP